MHHLTCGISSLLRSVNLILFTLLLVHLILRKLTCKTVSQILSSIVFLVPWIVFADLEPIQH